MELVHLLMNLVAAPVALTFLFIVLPLLFIGRFISSLIRSLSSENMSGKVVLITGASSGIGEHLAYEYAKRGAFLVLVARREKMLVEVAKKAGQLGSPDVFVIRADVSQADECKRFVQETVRRFGRLDHLVCNAGIVTFGKFENVLGFSNLRSVMDINFWGSIYPTYFAIPHLRKSKGKIVVNASGTSWLISPFFSFYGASKAAIINFYETMRIELAPEIKITIAAPWYTESEMVSHGKSLTKDGVVENNREMREVLIGKLPVMGVGVCAKDIVNGACSGERYVIEPSCYKILFLLQFFYPEIVQWAARQLYMGKSGTT